MPSASKPKSTPQNQANNTLNESFDLHGLARALPHTKELGEDIMAWPNQGESSKVEMLRESINAGFNKEKVGEEYEECLNWIDKQLDKQQNINHMLVNRMDQLTESIQILLCCSELSELSHCSLSHCPTSHHTTSSHSVSPPARVNPIWELMGKLPENEVYQWVTTEPQVTWKSEEIGFFDPHLDVSYGVGDLVSVRKNIYYCDMHLFVAQVANIARICGSELVAQNLHICLCETALQWYAALDLLQQISLEVSYDAWISSLTDQFKVTEFRVMKSLLASSFIIDNVKNGCNFQEYVQALVCDSKSAELFTQQQLLFAWCQLDPALMRDIFRLTQHITVTQFIDQLNEKWDVWLHYYNQPFQRFRKAQNAWNSHPNSASTISPNNRHFLLNKNCGSQWVIEPSNWSNYTSNSQQPSGLNNPNCNGRPWFAVKQWAYHVITDNDGDSDGEPYEDNDGYTETYSAVVTVQFNNSSHPHQDLPPFLCRLCYLTFADSNETQNHVLDWHDVDVNSASQKALMQDDNYHEHAVNNMITISQKLLSPHGYFTIQAMLFDSEALTTMCLDTGSTTMFIDKALISSHNRLQETQKVCPITACGLAGKQVLNHLIHLPMTISAQNPDGTLTIIQITTAVYVVDGLKAGVLLGMNTLMREMAQLDLEHQTLFIEGKMAQILYSDIFYISFHASIRPPMYEILVTQKAYYTNSHHMQTLNHMSSALWAVSENLTLHQLTLYAIKLMQLPCPSTCCRCCKQFSLRNQLHHHLHSTHRNRR